MRRCDAMLLSWEGEANLPSSQGFLDTNDPRAISR